MIAAWQMIFGTVPLLVTGFLIEGNPARFHWSALAVFCLLYLAVIGSALLFASLLVITANDCGKTTGDLADHTTWRGHVRVGNWRRDIFPVVAAWRLPVLAGVWMIFRKGAEPEPVIQEG
jgi:hypothetical protein